MFDVFFWPERAAYRFGAKRGLIILGWAVLPAVLSLSLLFAGLLNGNGLILAVVGSVALCIVLLIVGGRTLWVDVRRGEHRSLAFRYRRGWR
ncbi:MULTISPECIES: hypothetical protein [Pseudacidovorax]|jgi:hypothetical protein|uniref:Uncharacterized protein n=1 Tax=Pseudacidovorax intermedius TaxID=433924 RepID=A0A370FQ93_9BURK|nr:MULTISPECIES: hypothetical protein [Pseudacidovorax]MBO9644727.1 hypothetical protein [Pseudacidovorax sp.]MBP6894220.1 hypothetical protein [Pseudacidovorax sp.]RDI28529.1 hypothetical protein DFR41_101284 [Pseudacidovorax intermedius]